MGHSRRIATAGAAALIVSGLATAAAAHDRRFLHPPIHVATPDRRQSDHALFLPLWEPLPLRAAGAGLL
jgi:hypothetical protein